MCTSLQAKDLCCLRFGPYPPAGRSDARRSSIDCQHRRLQLLHARKVSLDANIVEANLTTCGTWTCKVYITSACVETIASQNVAAIAVESTAERVVLRIAVCIHDLS